MLPAGDQSLLRPLSLGEIFDRAVTLYVRNAALFSLLTLVVVVPIAIINYFATTHNQAAFAQILDQIQHPHKSAPATAPGDLALSFALLGAGIVLGAFVVVAIAAAVGQIYGAGQAAFGQSYAAALRRTGAIVLVLLCQIAVFAVVAFAGAFALGVVFVVAFLLVRSSAALGIAASVAALVIGLLWLLAMLLCYLAFAFAFNALGIEGAGAGAAIGRGFSRIFNRTELLRATLVSLALLAIYIGLMVVSISVTALFETVHLHLLNVLVSAAVSVVTMSFLGILLAVYYFDVRVRREGLDMQAQIEGLQAPAAGL